jgi:hypothetical protein
VGHQTTGDLVGCRNFFRHFIVFMDAHDEAGNFDRAVFVFWELILLAIILTLFFIYFQDERLEPIDAAGR